MLKSTLNRSKIVPKLTKSRSEDVGGAPRQHENAPYRIKLAILGAKWAILDAKLTILAVMLGVLGVKSAILGAMLGDSHAFFRTSACKEVFSIDLLSILDDFSMQNRSFGPTVRPLILNHFCNAILKGVRAVLRAKSR